jgi:CDP-diacylglycerol--glycerol-3-phosphate 3-phosphatidyltransferase
MDLFASSLLLVSCVVAFCVFLLRRPHPPGGGYCTGLPIRTGSLPGVLIDFWYWLLAPAIALLRRLGVTPNVITALSLPVAVVGALALALGHPGLGSWALLLAFGLDACDGWLAREAGVASAGGEFIDATVDRYTDLIILLGFLGYYRNELLPALLAGAALVGTSVVSYTRAKGEALGVDPNVGWMQRQERAVLLGAGAVLAPILGPLWESPGDHPPYFTVIIALALVAVGTNLTVIARTRYVVARLRGDASKIV